MIKVSAYRYDRGERLRPSRPYGDLMCSNDQSIGKALIAMLKYELGYGGEVVEASADRIITRTTMFSKIDHTVFEGSREDMLPLLVVYLHFTGVSSDEDFGKVYDGMEGTEVGEKLLRPLFLTTLGPMLVGEQRARRAMMAYLAETVEDVELFRKLPNADLEEMIAMKADRVWSIDDIRQLATTSEAA